jgi:hypothetical protein
LERLPSQIFSANKVFLAFRTMAYNLLIILGQQWRAEKEGTGSTEEVPKVRLRIKTIQDYLLCSAAIVGNHARKSLPKVNTWWLEKLRTNLMQTRIGRFLPKTEKTNRHRK